jgi:uncharacterized protein with beta-barrel porin domain
MKSAQQLVEQLTAELTACAAKMPLADLLAIVHDESQELAVRFEAAKASDPGRIHG